MKVHLPYRRQQQQAQIAMAKIANPDTTIQAIVPLPIPVDGMSAVLGSGITTIPGLEGYGEYLALSKTLTIE